MALERQLINPYRPLGQQEILAYCVLYVDEYLPEARRAIIRLAAYDGPCTKAQRRARVIRPFEPNARVEIVEGELFDTYLSLDATMQSETNLIRQAYLCATRSIPVPLTNEDDSLQIGVDEQPLLVESNEWAGLTEV